MTKKIINLTEKIELHDDIRGKLKENGKGKPIYWFVKGDNLFRKDGIWNELIMAFDRKNDCYTKIIRNSDGEIIRKSEHPLSEHKGHGSAKKK